MNTESTHSRAAENARGCRVERSFGAPARDVYRAWLDPGVVQRWLSPGDAEITRVELERLASAKPEVASKLDAGCEGTLEKLDAELSSAYRPRAAGGSDA